MAAVAETIDAPFTAFSFEVVLDLTDAIDGVDDPVCQGAFSECDGLEMSIEPKSVTAGGQTDFQTQLVGPTRYGQITLRRGMTTTADLWAWMLAVTRPGRAVTADGQITMIDGAGETQTTFLLEGCLPVRLRGPALNAQTGLVAVEELGLAVGRLTRSDGNGGGGFGIGANASIGGSIAGGVSASASGAFATGLGGSASAGLAVSGGLGLSGELGGTFSAGASGGIGAG
jgi:phage tail-like protein